MLGGPGPSAFGAEGELALNPSESELLEILLYAARLEPVAKRLPVGAVVRYYIGESSSVAEPSAQLSPNGPLPDPTRIVKDLQRAFVEQALPVAR